jgi:hypothetical protein
MLYTLKEWVDNIFDYHPALRSYRPAMFSTVDQVRCENYITIG